MYGEDGIEHKGNAYLSHTKLDGGKCLTPIYETKTKKIYKRAEYAGLELCNISDFRPFGNFFLYMPKSCQNHIRIIPKSYEHRINIMPTLYHNHTKTIWKIIPQSSQHHTSSGWARRTSGR